MGGLEVQAKVGMALHVSRGGFGTQSLFLSTFRSPAPFQPAYHFRLAGLFPILTPQPRRQLENDNMPIYENQLCICRLSFIPLCTKVGAVLSPSLHSAIYSATYCFSR